MSSPCKPAHFVSILYSDVPFIISYCLVAVGVTLLSVFAPFLLISKPVSYTVSCQTESNQVIVSAQYILKDTRECLWVFYLEQTKICFLFVFKLIRIDLQHGFCVFYVMFESVLCSSAIVLSFQSPLAFRLKILNLSSVLECVCLFVRECVDLDNSQSLPQGLVCLMYSCCLLTVQKKCYIIAIFIIWRESILLTAVSFVTDFRMHLIFRQIKIMLLFIFNN